MYLSVFMPNKSVINGRMCVALGKGSGEGEAEFKWTLDFTVLRPTNIAHNNGDFNNSKDTNKMLRCNK